ncbi:hypothetical protein H6F89_21535 [Cyanobacteria bacterium FACHB-63]|nr:hypothetical protein [Cyanobacteria bacterium FACHB-63]
MMSKFKFFSLFVLSVALTNGAANNIAAHAAESKVFLMAQNNALSRSDVDQVIAFFEWAFGAQFTPEQRNQYYSIKSNEFNNDPAATKRGIADVINNYKQAIAKPEAEQSRIRQGFNKGFVEQLRKLPNDAEARLLLSVYEAANSKDTASNFSDSSSGVRGISSIVGKWAWARTGSSTYAQGGAFVGANGSRFTYQFQPNGTVEYTGIMNVMSGGCSQQIFQSRKGKVRLSGSTMTINWSPGTFTRDFSCDRSNNYTKAVPAESETYQVRLKTDLGQNQLCLTRKEETCFSPTN